MAKCFNCGDKFDEEKSGFVFSYDGAIKLFLHGTLVFTDNGEAEAQDERDPINPKLDFCASGCFTAWMITRKPFVKGADKS